MTTSEPVENGLTPIIQRDDGQWYLSCAPSTVIIAGLLFDSKSGYTVALMFQGATAANILSPENAHDLIDALRDDADTGLHALAAKVEAMVEKCEVLNGAWERAGRPSTSITSSDRAGHA